MIGAEMGKQHRGAARVAFLARLGAIRSLFDAGHTLTAIYDAHRDALGVMSYSQFTRYVARYVRGQPKRLKGSEARLGALAGAYISNGCILRGQRGCNAGVWASFKPSGRRPYLTPWA